MRAQHEAFGVLGIEALHDAAPQQTRCAHLGNFQIEIHAHRPEKGQATCKVIDVHAFCNGGFHILFAIGQSESHFKRLIGTGLLHVIARNRNGVELRHVLGRVLDDVANDFHRWLGRIDVGVAHHELFQNVVLNGSRQFVLAHALLFSGHHITCQHRQYRTVHGHGHRHLVERNLVKQNLHVFHRVDGHAGLAHIARDTGMVGVIAAVGGQVESN